MATNPAPRTARDRPPEEASIDTSFARGLRILLTIADRGEARADELATALDMPVSTVYRYLRTLAEFGFVDRRGGRFLLGPRLIIGGGANVTSERLARHAGPILRELAERTGETAVVMRRVGLASVLLAQVEASRRVRVALEPEAHLGLHWTAMSRVLLAHAPEEIVDEVLARLAATDGSARSEALGAELDGIVSSGVATTTDEPTGAVAVAAPVIVSVGIVGALGVAGPTTRCDGAWVRRAQRLLPRAAVRLAEAIEAEAAADTLA